MYAAGFRVGKVASATHGTQHTVTCLDLHSVLVNGQIVQYVVVLQSYKHSGGQVKTIRLTRKYPPLLCPVSALTEYLALRGVLSGFLFQHQDGTVVSDTWISQLLKDSVTALGIDPGHYSSHSLHIGATTDLANSGASDAPIRVFGRWKSNAGAKYVRPDEIVV